jgi:uncharacterized membrane protein
VDFNQREKSGTPPGTESTRSTNQARAALGPERVERWEERTMKVNGKGMLIAAAAASLIASGAVKARAAENAASDMVHCSGVNDCKGHGECAGAGHGCAGKNACKGQGWVKMSKADCEKKGGKIEKGKE